MHKIHSEILQARSQYGSSNMEYAKAERHNHVISLMAAVAPDLPVPPDPELSAPGAQRRLYVGRGRPGYPFRSSLPGALSQRSLAEHPKPLRSINPAHLLQLIGKALAPSVLLREPMPFGPRDYRPAAPPVKHAHPYAGHIAALHEEFPTLTYAQIMLRCPGPMHSRSDAVPSPVSLSRVLEIATQVGVNPAACLSWANDVALNSVERDGVHGYHPFDGYPAYSDQLHELNTRFGADFRDEMERWADVRSQLRTDIRRPSRAHGEAEWGVSNSVGHPEIELPPELDPFNDED